MPAGVSAGSLRLQGQLSWSEGPQPCVNPHCWLRVHPPPPLQGALWPTALRPAPLGPGRLLWVGAGYLSCPGASSLSASRALNSPGAAFAPLACRDQAVCPGIPGELLTGRPLLAAFNPQGGGQGRMGCAEPERCSPASWLFSILTTALLAHQLLWEMLCHRACERVCV